MSKKETALALDKISKSFRQGKNKLHILNKASLTIHKGEIVALIGPSGCGKTTLLQIAGLLDIPDSGCIHIAGTSTRGIKDQARTELRKRHIGFVYQRHHLLPDFSALENLIIPQMLAGKTKQRAKDCAEQALQFMKLGKRQHHRPAELSGGEQQRVAIARAMMCDPSILLADEPTGNLDPDTAAEIFDVLLNTVRTAETSLLMVTHNHELAKKADRVVLLEHGKIKVET